MDILQLIGRTQNLFVDDLSLHEVELAEIVSKSSFLVLGGALAQIILNQKDILHEDAL